MTTVELYESCYADPAYRMKANRLDAVSQWLDAAHPFSLLDFGCGRGEVLEVASELGVFGAFGCEIVPSLCGDAVELIEPDTDPLRTPLAGHLHPRGAGPRQHPRSRLVVGSDPGGAADQPGSGADCASAELHLPGAVTP